MTDYQEMAIKVYHKEDATYAAKQIAHELLINSGWTEQDINKCQGKNARDQVMVILA